MKNEAAAAPKKSMSAISGESPLKPAEFTAIEKIKGLRGREQPWEIFLERQRRALELQRIVGSLQESDELKEYITLEVKKQMLEARVEELLGMRELCERTIGYIMQALKKYGFKNIDDALAALEMQSSGAALDIAPVALKSLPGWRLVKYYCDEYSKNMGFRDTLAPQNTIDSLVAEYEGMEARLDQLHPALSASDKERLVELYGAANAQTTPGAESRADEADLSLRSLGKEGATDVDQKSDGDDALAA